MTRRACNRCGDPVDVDARKCAGCGSYQFTNRGMILGFAIVGALLLPVGVAAASVAVGYGIPSGLTEGMTAGVTWGIASIPVICLLLAAGGFQQRREAL